MREPSAYAWVSTPITYVSPSRKRCEQLATSALVIGIGECGFDAGGAPPEAQTEAFAIQCALARELSLPLVLHVDGEGSWDRLTANATSLEGLTVIRHYFTGDAAEAEWHGSRGDYLSFGNPLRRDQQIREIARNYPEHLLLIETDSYPLPNRNTEPAHVSKVGETLAMVRGWTFSEAREKLSLNTRTAFPALGGG